jgi:hypothetical protein
MRNTHIDDPLGTYMPQFQKHLEKQFYKPATIAEYDQCLTALGYQMKAANVEPEHLNKDLSDHLKTGHT